MVIFDFTQMYVNLTALLLLISGGMMWAVDVRLYDKTQMTREKTWSMRLAWVNISLAVVLFVTRWVYLNFFR